MAMKAEHRRSNTKYYEAHFRHTPLKHSHSKVLWVLWVHTKLSIVLIMGTVTTNETGNKIILMAVGVVGVLFIVLTSI